MVIPDEKVDGKWVGTRNIGGVRCLTESYSRWKGFAVRASPSFKARRPTYAECSFSAGFRDFQRFTDWHVSQTGYGLGYEIDKDILFPGNKVYAEDTCVLVPRHVNLFFKGRYNVDRKPTKDGRFGARCSYKGALWDYKTYATAEQADAAYHVNKAKIAARLADELEADGVVIDPRVIERLRAWSSEYGNS